MTRLKILVTGATGFIGSHLARRLTEEGHAVRILSRDSRTPEGSSADTDEVVRGDIRDAEAVDRAVAGVDAVYHLVSNFRRPELSDAVCRAINVGGTRNVLEACLRQKVAHLIHCSTIGVHGHVEHPPANEEAPFNPGDIYQATKLEAEKLVWFFHQEHGLPVTVIRPTSVYGPGDLRMLKMFRLIQKRRFFILGDGKALFHPVYIDDLVEGLRLCLGRREAVGRVMIIGGDEVVTLNELSAVIAADLGVAPPSLRLPIFPFYALGYLCELVCVPLGIRPPIFRRRVKFFVNHRAFDISKARAVLGYNPTVNLKTGINRTIEWYREMGVLELGA